MSDLKARKEQNINFRVEEDIKEKIVEMAKKENLNLSSFMKKVVMEYPELVQSSRQLEESNTVMAEAKRISSSLKDKLDSYKALEFERLFNKVRGKEYKGKQIRTESDLLRIFVRESTIKLKQEEKEIEVDINDIVVEEERKSRASIIAIIIFVTVIAIATIVYLKRKAS